MAKRIKENKTTEASSIKPSFGVDSDGRHCFRAQVL